MISFPGSLTFQRTPQILGCVSLHSRMNQSLRINLLTYVYTRPIVAASLKNPNTHAFWKLRLCRLCWGKPGQVGQKLIDLALSEGGMRLRGAAMLGWAGHTWAHGQKGRATSTQFLGAWHGAYTIA